MVILFLQAMLLTAVIETFVLWCFKYRGWKVLSYFCVLNLVSNFLINLTYYHTWMLMPKYVLIPILEFSVVIFEASLLGLMTGYNKKLWLSVFLTNLISYTTGVLIYGF